MTAVEKFSPAVSLWDAQQKALIKEQIARDCTDDELRLFAQVCAKTGLDPFSRQIYAIKRNDKNAPGGKKMSIQVSIDGFRIVAERSREYEGQTPKQWCGQDGVWRDLWLEDKPPVAARAGVWRTGFREPLYMVALWKDYAQSTPMWTKMGAHMLAKCAEAQALRAAFPADLSGLYSTDEMGHEPVATRGRPVRSTSDGEHGNSLPTQDRPSALPAGEGTATPQAAPVPSPVEVVTSSPASSGARRTFAPPKKAADDVEPLSQREARLSAKRMAAEFIEHGAPEPEPPEGVQPALMTALRDALGRVTNDSVRKELAGKWSEAGLPNVKAPAVVLTQEQYEAALVLVQDAEEACAELEKPFDEPEQGTLGEAS